IWRSLCYSLVSRSGSTACGYWPRSSARWRSSTGSSYGEKRTTWNEDSVPCTRITRPPCAAGCKLPNHPCPSFMPTRRARKMQIPAWLIVAAAVVLALPFGWGLGLLVAYVVAGKDFGQLPAAVRLGLLAALAFALWPSFSPSTRLKVVFLGSAAFILLAWLIA